ncbi:hypothetical protein LOC67_21520 [Stieleria sp. JC731]|uniref:HEAT repeat domain-containing protein n=1 Tax=Pirellulaceae TaxID=2691357 RepID=UPI001E4C1111|nr:hypothetical protein [Stieleria sp. JC731]MCC9603137.1 hypothetical protein [Stieleria sp. JC731]
MKHYIAIVFAVLVASCWGSYAQAQTTDPQLAALGKEILDVDYVMFLDPEFFSNPPVIEISSAPLDLWLKAVKRSDAKLQRTSLDTIAIAKRRGMPEIDKALPVIDELLQTDDLEITVRRAAVSAMIQFEDPSTVARLVQQARDYGTPIASIVEPAMVVWKNASLKEDWQKRLTDRSVRLTPLRTAIEGLAAIEDQASSDSIRSIVSDSIRPASLRVCAARALGQLHDGGLEDLAETLSEDRSSKVTSLLAVELLRQHTSEKTIEILLSLANSETDLDHGMTKAAAMKRLYQIDPEIVNDVAKAAVHHDDYAVRDIAAGILHTVGSKENIEPLALLLADESPTLRRSVATMLFELAQKSELTEEVISQSMAILDQDDWRGCEQATRVLVSLDYKPSGDRLVDLIRHPRGETMIAAGWGLRLLSQEQHLDAMLGRAQEIYDRYQSGEYTTDTPGPGKLLTQLFLAFGQMDFLPAEPLMRTYVPRNLMLGDYPRGAACWSLGVIHEGEVDEDLVKIMEGRIRDTEALIPEFDTVRQMCALAIGRMGAEQAMPTLQKYASMRAGGVGMACFWAIERLTGEAPPPLPPGEVFDYKDWFMQPLKDDAE